MYRKRDTGEVFKLHSEIRAAYPNPTLPAIITDEILDEVGYDVVDTVSELPTCNHEVEKVVELGVTEKEGKWVQEYAVVPLSAEELAEKAAVIAHDVEVYMAGFREMRRELLNVLLGIAIAEDKLAEFKALRLELLNIPQVAAVAAATTALAKKAAIKAEYVRIVKAAPVVFVAAFKELNG